MSQRLRAGRLEFLKDIVLAVVPGLVFIGGINRNAKVADLLLPVKTLAYVAVTLYVIVLQFDHAPMMLLTIIKSACGLDQAFGGLIGSAIVMRVKRCVLANEAGLGSDGLVLTQNSLAAVIDQGV
ncbi:Na+/alanine symporter [Pseudomonas putida]|nr:Na+/alanine symporter [Pseudomonas putida]